MKKILLTLAALFSAALAETSAFDAGNINNNSGYGLTQNEKILKDKLDTLNNNYLQNNARINSVNEQIEGIQSTLEGINSQYSKTNTKITQLEQNLSKELQKLRVYAEESRKIQEANNKQIKQVLSELSQLMDTYINQNTQDQNLSQTPQITSSTDENKSKQVIPTTQKKQDDESWKKKELDELLELALKEFNNKNNYENSKVKFEYLIEKNYKPALSNFHIGEIEYKKKRYANAINYYKKSAQLYSKAKYMPTLLYHTAISLDKVGDTKAANGFYQALKKDYPQSKEAKAAPNRK
ncbi:hypothetical protein DMB95_08470 [Campylobacter sp. MIT 12-8780]|uniref:tetratricopeptide repeat protein n=1 Tax=unclassified Campylobacter TaxID=2593542 RepID=UPI0010F9A07A|nr:MULTISPECIES: tetratricopeptide repeat protein [unclassified Campylobacter]NDJ27369.1 hypothetical protein [Campylobacter sp. MIT 19-121]TKX28495.1 hypothetical protein CQA38_07405 [Campylobacter sp. MIT 12-5580]TQR40239.1 hypothetical protein DMB95_08470 [Campylobacter sp. MIT 12-8780]